MPLLHHFNLHFFDIDSTRRFLKHLQDIKRIRKGKVQILLLANRVKPNSASSKDIQQFFEKIEHEPIAWIAERSAYGSLAMQGLSVFDKPQKKLYCNSKPVAATFK